ncbi:MAG: YgaP family membrane protein [Halohasta sp.]
MESNVGGLDRTVRLVGGLLVALVGAGSLANLLPLGSTLGAVLTVGGLIVLGTGLTQQCLAYRLFGVNTCKRS